MTAQDGLSFHRLVKLGIYPNDWAGDVSDDGGDFEERSSA
jgi:putative transposase